MCSIRSLLCCLPLACLPVACSGGGTAAGNTGSPTTDPTSWAGTWQVSQVQVSTTCSNPGIETEFSLVITLSGAQANVAFGFGLTLDVVDGRLQGVDAFTGGVEYDLGLTGTDTFVGTRRTPIPTNPPCEYVYEWRGTRTAPAKPASLEFEGMWDVTEYLASSTLALPDAPPRSYELSIQVLDAAATLTQVGLPTLVLPIIDERIVGAVARGGITASYDLALAGKDGIAGTLTLTFDALGVACTQTYGVVAGRVAP